MGFTQIKYGLFVLIIGVLGVSGCAGRSGNNGNIQNYPVYSQEAQWIKSGDSLEYEGELWYPADGVESFTDTEMYLLGEYRSVQFFADKVDVKPDSRIYTKFGRNKFRFYEKRQRDD